MKLLKVATSLSGRQAGHATIHHLSCLDNARIVTVAMIAYGGESRIIARYYDTKRHDPSTDVESHDELRTRIY